MLKLVLQFVIQKVTNVQHFEIFTKDVFNLFYRGLDGKKSIPVSYNPQIVQISMDLLPIFAQGQNF